MLDKVDISPTPLYMFSQLVKGIFLYQDLYYFKKLIESIVRKTMFQGKLEDINAELDFAMLENEESRGMSK